MIDLKFVSCINLTQMRNVPGVNQKKTCLLVPPQISPKLQALLLPTKIHSYHIQLYTRIDLKKPLLWFMAWKSNSPKIPPKKLIVLIYVDNQTQTFPELYPWVTIFSEYVNCKLHCFSGIGSGNQNSWSLNQIFMEPNLQKLLSTLSHFVSQRQFLRNNTLAFCPRSLHRDFYTLIREQNWNSDTFINFSKHSDSANFHPKRRNFCLHDQTHNSRQDFANYKFPPIQAEQEFLRLQSRIG